MNQKKISKGITTIIGMCLILVLMTGCTIQPTGYAIYNQEESIKIGWIGPLSGQSAVLGIDSVVAAEIAVAEINANGGVNGQTLELIVQDDAYNIKKATDAYNNLVNVQGVDYLLMHTYGSVYALADQAKADGVVILDPIDCNEDLAGLNDAVFCLATDSESIADVIVEEIGDNDIGILHWNNDLFMPLIASYIEEKSDSVVYKENYVAGTSDFKTQLLQMQELGIEHIVLLGYDETGIAMKQAKELSMDVQFYTTGTITSPSLQEAAAGNAEGAILAYWEAPENAEFESKFIAIQERPPILDLATYPTYDAVYAFANALESELPVAEALYDVEFEGLTGTVDFAKDGSVRIQEFAYELVAGFPQALN